MPTRNVVLTDHQHEVIETLIRSGRYQNASEVLRDGLRLVEKREAEDEAKLQALRKAVDIGWRDHEAGRFREVAEEDLPEFIAELGERAAGRLRTRG